MKECKYGKFGYVDIIDTKQHTAKWCEIYHQECVRKNCKEFKEDGENEKNNKGNKIANFSNNE